MLAHIGVAGSWVAGLSWVMLERPRAKHIRGSVEVLSGWIRVP